MAMTAQIHTDQQNTRTAGRNPAVDGLAGKFGVLPYENREEYRQLLAAYFREYAPATPTEEFLVTELAQAQWRLRRADAIEAECVHPSGCGTYAEIARAFRATDNLGRLDRYAQAARRAYFNALKTLKAFRRDAGHRPALERQRQPAGSEHPQPAPAVEPQPLMPVHLQRELDALRRTSQDFQSHRERSRMSGELRRWFDRRGASADGKITIQTQSDPRRYPPPTN